MTEHKDHAMEADFEASGSVYPKVTAARIDELMQQVTFSTHIVPGTTTTIATAMLQIGAVKFTLANEFTACVDPRNFNAELGAKYAIEKATESARNKLWELEGYALAQFFANGVTNHVTEAQLPVENFDFGTALTAIKAGCYVSRKGWNGPGQYIFGIGMPGSGDYWTYTNGKNDNCKLVPFLAIRTVQNSAVPWLASQTDMLATDWYIVE